MPSDTSRLSRLVDLARESSSDKRRELLREVTDVFLEQPEDYNDSEKSHFGEILGRVSADMDVAVRRRLAEQFAREPNAPRGLIAQLANDELEVARDVLLESTVLRDSDLIQITMGRNDEKLNLIAKRANVSEAVSEAIVEHGSDTVVAALVSNTGAQVSRNTFRKVVDRSETSAVLQAPLLDRADVPADMLNEMFTFVSQDLRTKLKQKIDAIPPEVLEKALQEAAREVRSEMKNLKDEDRKAMVYVAEMARQKQLTEGLLVQLVRNHKPTELIHALAKLSDVDVKTTRRLINARNIEGLAIICRSMRYERATFSAIVMMMVRGTGSSSKSLNQVLDLYEKVTTENAQRVMRFWRVRREVAPGGAPGLAQAG